MKGTMIAVGATRASGARADQLTDEECDEALVFLAGRPAHTVVMAGLLREHGVRVPTPPGDFYGCREKFLPG